MPELKVIRSLSTKTRSVPERGISYQKICVGTIIERAGKSYIHAFNNGKPTKDDLKNLCSHISDGTFVWTDDLNGYDTVLKKKHCPHVGIKSGTSYDQVNHLNTVNNLHQRISEWLRTYRNVSSIYINRYSALFALRQKYAGCDKEEILLYVLKWLRTKRQYFRRKDLHSFIFENTYVNYRRDGLMSIFDIRRLVRDRGYSVIIEKNSEFTNS